ncbi:MAG: type II toxin-antitoxin system Phd/YefM family antitoxin [Desulfococcaceae bacterium]
METKSVEIQDVQSQLSELFSLVAEGTEIVIFEGEKPFARILPARTKRIPGLHRGCIQISPDFDDPLPDSFWSGEE